MSLDLMFEVDNDLFASCLAANERCGDLSREEQLAIGDMCCEMASGGVHDGKTPVVVPGKLVSVLFHLAAIGASFTAAVVDLNNQVADIAESN